MVLVSDAVQLPFGDQSVDLVFGSPPYCDARDYGIGAQRGCQDWIDWMLDVTTESLRVCRGPVLWVCAGVTRDRTYWPGPEGLLYEWWKRGGSLYRPCYWHRVGIPGSGGDDWFRADVEYVLCFKRDGALPWSNPTAMGKPPVLGPGGEMSYRTAEGKRVGKNSAALRHGGMRGERIRKRVNRVQRNGEGEHAIRGDEIQRYKPPAIANPANWIGTKVGGGALGDSLAHESEAPFPERLAEWFIRSLCPEGGFVLDPFSGSGTTVKVAKRFKRRGIGGDIRFSQAELGRKRLQRAQVELFA